jgi:purine-binding chemotaxis protein CheW
MTIPDVPDQLVVFTLEGQRYAVPVSSIERVARIVEIAPLPNAPDIVDGVIDVHGRPTPVINVRRRLTLPHRDMSLTDQLVVARAGARQVALVVDTVVGVVRCTPEQVVDATQILPGLEHVRGVLKLADGMVLIQDLDKFLSLHEETELARALEAS